MSNQVQFFSDGGFVLHKYRGCSGWFDADGKLLDAKRRNARGSMRKPSAARLAGLERIGKLYKKIKDAQERARRA